MLKPKSFYSSNHWLNVLILKNKNKTDLGKIIKRCHKNGIEVRPVWKPNHMQLPFKKFQKYNVRNANKIVLTHLCIPSSPDLKFKDQKKIYKIIDA